MQDRYMRILGFSNETFEPCKEEMKRMMKSKNVIHLLISNSLLNEFVLNRAIAVFLYKLNLSPRYHLLYWFIRFSTFCVIFN